MKSDLRTLMPYTAKRIDRMREQLGVAATNEILRNAMAGKPGKFFAMENGMTFGTPETRSTTVINWGENGKCYRTDPQWMIDATEFALTRGIEIETVDINDHEEARRRAATLRKVLAEAKYGK
ncbi:hypothetical protein ACO0LF_03660 [Undibacterium sp. Di27W]|uniref:hypothetical protein n=1 Tax=Undibacterium sp. Di27W TaxID=3413036 RepID=UPI003BF028BA